MKYTANVTIRWKPEIPDVLALKIMGDLRNHQIDHGVVAVHTGKIIDMEIEAEPDQIDDVVTNACGKLLANSVTETFSYKLTAHHVQQDGTVVKAPVLDPIIDRTSKSPFCWIDIADRWPAIGPYRMLRAEWLLSFGMIFVLIRYSKDGVEQQYGWRLDLSKRAFLGDLETEIGRNRARSLRKLAGEITDYVIANLS